MELRYVLIQDAELRHVLCERVAVAGGLWLYRYVSKYDVFVDEGYAEDLDRLKQMLAERYRFGRLLLIKGFEEAVKHFALCGYPRVICLKPGETFCTRISGEVFEGELRGGGEFEFVEMWMNAERPKSLKEALEKLDEYAERRGAWVILKRYPRHVFAYLAYPSP
jgi:hypothetical protein